METSKIVVDAVEFQRAMAAAIAVAGKEPLDLVQFRIVADELVVSARSHTEAIAVEVSTSYLDVDYDRDGHFEITKAEARALNAMRMKKEDPDEELSLGLLVHEAYVQRTDESGLGLGLRAVKVRRNGNPYESVLGDVPHSLAAAAREPATSAQPKMDGSQWSLVGKVAKELDVRLMVWSNSEPGSDTVRTNVAGAGVAMLVLCSDLGREEDNERSSEPPESATISLNFEDVAKSDAVPKVVTAKPPKGLA